MLDQLTDGKGMENEKDQEIGNGLIRAGNSNFAMHSSSLKEETDLTKS